MKKLLAMLMTGMVMFTMSCGDDETATPDKTTTPPDEAKTETVLVGSATTFTDTDALATSRAWSVTPTVGATPPSDLTGKTAEFTFTNPGTFIVTSTRAFDDTFTKASNKLVYTVTVLGEVKASVTISGPDGDVTLADGTKYQLDKVQDMITITNTSEGSPETTVVSFTGTDAPSDITLADGANTSIAFPTEGVFGMTVTATRTEPAGTDAVTYTELFEVVVPTIVVPLTLNNWWVADAKTLVLAYNIAVDPASLDAADFVVDVNNMGTMVAGLTVASVAVSGDNSDQVTITMADDFFKSDLIAVDNSGTVKGVNETTAAAFTDLPFAQSINLDGSFEGTGLVDGVFDRNVFAQAFFFATQGSANIINDGFEYETWNDLLNFEADANLVPNSGKACVHYKTNAATDVADLGINQLTAEPLVFTVGEKYYFSAMVNVISEFDIQWQIDGCEITADNDCIADGEIALFTNGTFNTVTSGGWGNAITVLTKDITGDGWVNITGEFEILDSTENVRLFLRLKGLGEVLIDDVYIVLQDPRP